MLHCFTEPYVYDLITVFHLLASVLFLPLQTPKFVDEELFKKKKGGGAF